MPKDKNGVQVKVGDVVVVKAQGLRVKGKVTEVAYWGEDYGWDIEMDEANVPGGYSRWKQGTDGGQLVEVNGEVLA